MSGSCGRVVRAGVIGYGFMGQTHARAYRAAGAAGCGVVLGGVADVRPDRIDPRGGAAGNLGEREGGVFDPEETRVFASCEEMLASGGVDVVSVCTPTDTHLDVARRAIGHGVHVLIEKPVALESAGVRALARDAERGGVLAMPAMCMRYWPGWVWLKEAVEERRYGAVVSARFERIGSPPGWSSAFYLDESRSGGALFDLHVHDADFIVHMLGMPIGVRSVGSRAHVTSVYRFGEGGPRHVVASGGWLTSPHTPFRMRYVVEFERAVADFDLTREPALLVHDGEGSLPVEIGDGTGYDGQVRALVGAIGRGDQAAPTTLDEAAGVLDLLGAEVESLRQGRETELPRG